MGILIAYLLGILTASDPKHQDRNAHYATPNSQSAQHRPDGLISVICIPPTPTGEEEAENKKTKRRATIKFRSEIGGIVILLVYTFFTGFQTLLLRQQNIGIFAASMPAESPRPTPFSGDLDLLRHQGVSIYFGNVGKVTSPKLFVEGQLTRQKITTYESIGQTENRSLNATAILPYTQMPNGVSGFFPGANPHLSFDTSDFTQNDIDEVIAGREVVEIRGHSLYNNGFWFGTVEENFCFLYWTPTRHVFKNGASTGGGEGAWGECDDIKRAIAESQQWGK
jgi:hypothetical protein